MTEQNYDVVMYFYWAPVQVIHKYLSLHKKLQEHCSVLTIINEGEFGPNKDDFYLFAEKDKKNVVLRTRDEALDTLRNCNFKVGVFSSNGRKGWVGPGEVAPPALGARWPALGKDIEIAKEKGAISIQISEMITDCYYAGADIVSLPGPLTRDLHIRPAKYGTGHAYQWRPYDARPEPKYIYSNCLLWDSTGDCLPYSMDREQFCAKYGLDPDQDIIVYLPTEIRDATSGISRRVYEEVCKQPNVIVKLHPKEYGRFVAHRYNNKWSYELCDIDDVRILEPIDTHWCYKHADVGISNRSSVGIEFTSYNTPFLYVEPPRFPWSSVFLRFGNVCSLQNMEMILGKRMYKEPLLHLDQLTKFTHIDINRSAADILSEQIRELLVGGDE